MTALLLLSGCAGPRRGAPSPSAGDLPLEPAEAGRDGRGGLPGSGRHYPSEDPRNQAPPGAPEAFPAGEARGDPRGGSGGAPPSAASWHVQLFAARSQEVAAVKALEVAPRFPVMLRVVEEDGVFKVRTDPVASEEAAAEIRKLAVSIGFADAFVRSGP